ncbi:MAG TPA: hypothetical protein VMU65_11260 [Candidatus Saccharimonadales bacterium]|nr:hypothetical protein [Candidatus Saccharimonadales bacterium]
MRADSNADSVERFLRALGAYGRAGDRVYLAGGATAVTVGWRSYTQDVDVRLESDAPDDLLRGISELKERLDVNVELAGPLDFLPEPAGWRDRSPYLGRYGAIDVFQTDFALQALAKLERGLDRDLADVEAMLERGLTTPDAVKALFVEIQPELFRFPAVDGDSLATRVAAALER